MADRMAELKAERENEALKKLQAAAGLVDKPQAERVDWMYEQSAVQAKKTDEELMNMPISSDKDKDMEDVKNLGENTAGSLFLRSATKTTEDMLRKLREDPLFQIRREEQNARASMMANPLIMARVRQKQEKLSKKDKKKMKKAQKKEKKAMKKAAKKEKKGKKKKSSSSSSSDSSDSDDPKGGAQMPAQGKRGRSPSPAARRGRDASRSPRRSSTSKKGQELDLKSLGPSGVMIDKREERAQEQIRRRDAAIASRGAAKGMSEEEKQRRLDQMKMDAAKHDKHKDDRIASADVRQKELDERDAKSRTSNDPSYFREMRKEAYMSSENQTMADRLKTQRHRRAKGLNDPLERPDR